MFVNTLILSLFSSLDAFGIGITYGLKNTKFSFPSQIAFFCVALISTFVSVFLGNGLKNYLSVSLANFIGSTIIIGIGIYTIYDSFKNHKDFDFDKSNDINAKEAITLSLSVTADSLCIGLGSSLIGINTFLFPIFVAIFHLSFLLLGDILGKNILGIGRVPNQLWNVISGIILILIGIIRCF